MTRLNACPDGVLPMLVYSRVLSASGSLPSRLLLTIVARANLNSVMTSVAKQFTVAVMGAVRAEAVVAVLTDVLDELEVVDSVLVLVALDDEVVLLELVDETRQLAPRANTANRRASVSTALAPSL